MTEQLAFIEPPPPHQAHSATSREAATSVLSDLSALQTKVYAWFKSVGSYGATDEEIQLALGMNPSTQRPRRIELASKGLIVNTGTTRKARSGRAACVWRVSEPGHQGPFDAPQKCPPFREVGKRA